MKRLLVLAFALAALVLVPLAVGAPDKNKPTTSETCPNVQYGDPVLVTSYPAGAEDDVNGDGWVCMKTVAGGSNGGSSGPQFIDNTAHNQNG
jgi:hypothetical protein